MPLQVRNSPFSEEQVQLLNQLLSNLDGTQRVWLSGYLSAQVASANPINETNQTLHAVQETKAQQEITILYGTQTGNAEELAEKFTEVLQGKGLVAKPVAMNDFKPRDLKKLTHVLIIISTHGEGDPPDNAIGFFDFIFGKRAPKLDHLQYSVLALGDSSYEQFCLTGKQLDERFAELGGKRIAERVDCDLDFDEPADAWFGALQPTLEGTASTQTGATAATTSTSKVTSLYSRTNPFEAEVLENINLNGRGSNKETRHLELLIEDSNLKFEPGDSIGIYAENDQLLVDELIAFFNWQADETLTIKEQQYTIREALTHYYEITVLTKPLLQKLQEQFPHDKLRYLLAEDNNDKLRDYIENHDLLDIVRDIELTNVSADVLTPLLRKMPARLYSIASSYTANPEEVHLTIGAVRYHAGGRDRKGVCSTQIADRVQPGDTLKIYVHKNQNFRLPEDTNTPIIMIGPGTGIAPFRSFMEERAEQNAEGKAWLFFGDQHYVTDFLYQVEWQQWVKDGYLTNIDLAFSRDQEEKVYVQHRMLARKTEIYEWLESGAVIYVCGDEKSMAKDVHETLIQIVQDEGGLSEADATQYVLDLQQNKRYQRDVY